jgi:hypothetical protein
MTNTEIAVGLLISRLTRPSQGECEDTSNSGAIEASLRLLRQLVVAKLGRDPALERLEFEANNSGEVHIRTRARLALALKDAADDDLEFARNLQSAVSEALKSSHLPTESHGTVVNQITGNVSGRALQARDIHGNVTFNDRRSR